MPSIGRHKITVFYLPGISYHFKGSFPDNINTSYHCGQYKFNNNFSKDSIKKYYFRLAAAIAYFIASFNASNASLYPKNPKPVICPIQLSAVIDFLLNSSLL